MNGPHEDGKRLPAVQRDAAEAPKLVGEALDLMALLEPPSGGAMARPELALICTVTPRSTAMKERSGVTGGIGDDVADALQSGQKSLGLA